MIKLFKKKEKDKVLFNGRCAEIVFTEEAIAKGVTDDFQKEIQIVDKKVWIEKGKVKIIKNIVEKIPFSVADVIAVEKVYKIPIFDRTHDYGEEFEFNEVLSLEGIIKERRVV